MISISKKKAKKSKHGKKNWRKNIDMTEIEIKENELNKEAMFEDSIKNKKADELYSIDNTSTQNIKLLNKKTNRSEQKKEKRSKFETKMINQIMKNNKYNKSELKKEDNEIDLWDDEDKNIKKEKETIIYPKVPIAHPGQSYNPEKKDVEQLLKKVVDLNKNIIKEEIKDNKKEDKYYESEESSIENEIKVSNNPAVDDSNRLSKKQKKDKFIKKQNRLKNKHEIIQKQQKIIIFNSLSNKRLEKEKAKNIQLINQQKNKEKQELQNKKNLLKNGIIDNDKQFLEDFQISKSSTLRTLSTDNNFLRERFNNILKRNVLGEYNQINKSKRNRKLNQIKILDLKNRDDLYLDDSDNKLKIFN